MITLDDLFPIATATIDGSGFIQEWECFACAGCGQSIDPDSDYLALDDEGSYMCATCVDSEELNSQLLKMHQLVYPEMWEEETA